MKKYYYRAKLFNTQIVRVYCASFHEAIILVKNIAIESGWNDEIVDIQD